MVWWWKCRVFPQLCRVLTHPSAVDRPRSRPTRRLQPGDGSSVDPLRPPALPPGRNATPDRPVRPPGSRPGVRPVSAVGMAQDRDRRADARRRPRCPTVPRRALSACSSSTAALVGGVIGDPRTLVATVSERLASRAFHALLAAAIAARAPRRLRREAWRVADELGWAKTYDAEYVALARVLRCRLFTIDDRLRRSAGRIVEIVGPRDL